MKSLLMICTLAGLAAAADPIVKHPRELRFPQREFTPPKAADFQHKLSNGATAFLVEDHDFPLINVSVTIRTGDYLDPAGKIGLAQITGSQMRSGGTKTKAPAAFDEEVAFLAATINSNISDVVGQAGLNCLSKDLDAGLALFTDMLRNPGFAEDRLKLAKAQMLQQMERRNDGMPQIEQREFQRLVRGDKHFTSQQVTKASLEAIGRQDMVDFHARYYFPANFVIAVSGDFDTKQMLAKLEKALAGWPNRSEAIPDPPAPGFTPTPGVYVVNKTNVNQGRVRMGHIGVSISNPDHLALAVMNGILGGNQFTSRITERVRSDEGLAYSASSAFPAGTYYEGVFAAAFQSKSPSVAQAMAIVIEELQRLQNTNVSAEELSVAINHAVELLPGRFATASQKAGQFASDFYTKLPADYWQKYRQRVSAVTVEEIQRVARKYLQPDKLVILAVGDVETMLRGNPDRPQYSIAKLAGDRGVTRIPLPDPLTMVYPAK
jgi:predicted Zn-dependent peptidase